MILYLHGFRSSPLSFKAQAMADYMNQRGLGEHFSCPQLPESPVQSVMLAMQLLEDKNPENVLLVGSSLGGYYATWLAENLGCKAVLLNPVVDPWSLKIDDMDSSSETFELSEWRTDREKYEKELLQIQIHEITHPERYLLIAATGDELLDYEQMIAHYRNAQQIIIEGSDHSLMEFTDYLDDILAFSGLKAK